MNGSFPIIAQRAAGLQGAGGKRFANKGPRSAALLFFTRCGNQMGRFMVQVHLYPLPGKRRFIRPAPTRYNGCRVAFTPVVTRIISEKRKNVKRDFRPLPNPAKETIRLPKRCGCKSQAACGRKRTRKNPLKSRSSEGSRDLDQRKAHIPHAF